MPMSHEEIVHARLDEISEEVRRVRTKLPRAVPGVGSIMAGVLFGLVLYTLLVLTVVIGCLNLLDNAVHKTLEQWPAQTRAELDARTRQREQAQSQAQDKDKAVAPSRQPSHVPESRP